MKLEFKLATRAWRAGLMKRFFGDSVRALVVRSDTGLFAVDPEDFVVGRKLRKHGTYGTEEMDRVRPAITPESRVLVVGAHIGTLAIPLARFCREVVAVEANPDTCELLRMNVALNAAWNCRIVEIAASDKEELLPFVKNRANSGGSKRAPKIDKYIYHYDHPETVQVRAASLDRILEDLSFQVVVMDIEGSEYFALRGMQEILARSDLLMVEFLPHHLRNVAGVTVGEFLSVIEPHFSRMTIPSQQLVVRAGGFLEPLERMYRNDEGDTGLVFDKQ